MSTFLRHVLFMLVLFTAKSLDKISVNPDRISSLNNNGLNSNKNHNNIYDNNNKNNNENIISSPTLNKKLHNHDQILHLDHDKYINRITPTTRIHYQQQRQKNNNLKFYSNNEAAYLLPLHPSMQQQLLLQQEFEQQKKYQDSLQSNGFTTPFQSLTSTIIDDDNNNILKQKFIKPKQFNQQQQQPQKQQKQSHHLQQQRELQRQPQEYQQHQLPSEHQQYHQYQQQQQQHNHGRYSPQYSQKYTYSQINHGFNNIHNKISQHLPQPQAQRQATKIEYYNTGGSSNSNSGGINNENNKYYYHNNFHIPDSSIIDIDNAGAGGISSLTNLPKIPPFPAISAFNFFGGNKGGGSGSSSSGGGLADTHKSCGGILNARHGIVQTPNFPNKFETPIVCVWIIDASEFATTATNISIVVYLNQLYVLGGLKFTEYMYYSEDYKVPSHRIFELTEDDVTQVTWIQFQSQYLEIRFEMRSLDGTHLRALNRFLDVYGFNITYEVDQVKSYQCNALKCHFLGQCYASDDFSSYYCSCFKGFKGSDCSRGPLCEQNYCENGGTCKQIGDVAVKCICPKGFKGNKCEVAEITEVSTSCNLNKSAQCHHLCLQNDAVRAMNNGCKCNITKMTSPNTNEKHTNRTGKTRFEVTIRLGTNLTALFRSVENADKKSGEHHLPTLLEKLVSFHHTAFMGYIF
ncbi:hybrid signal transduction histidine kinase K-like [Condylostylus longicornis]|uniref:hybrid signal transduction histidine kinase K-like n=1 Tax=Condylostylus longicornis TaxID=2530218 RepID=UPI00244E5911|nr:hybrid signal transduction histidine kinase K-like [Condylostylus longicornis]